MKGLLQNRNFIFSLALLLGVFAPGRAQMLRPLILPVLGLTMILSTMDIRNDTFRNPRGLFGPALIGILMNYLLLGGIILAIGALFIKEDPIRNGVILLAAAPPAAAVIPFSDFLKGDKRLSLTGTIGAYIGGLVIIPLMALVLLSPGVFDPTVLVIAVVELIVIPLIASRILIWKNWNEKISPWKGTITNWSFFLIMYTLVGLNSSVFRNLSPVLLTVSLIPLSTNFILGLIIDGTGRVFHLTQPVRTSLVLLGTLKNQGMAGGLALALFGKEAAIPAAVCTISMIVYVIWLDLIQGQKKQ